MNGTVSAVVEGDVDAAVIRRLADEARLRIASIHVKGGKQNVRSRIGGYNLAARHSPFIDRERAAKFLRVPAGRIPDDPEMLHDPKRSFVDIARSSSNRDLREDVVPRPGSGRAVGQAYSSRLIEFIVGRDGWRPSVAAERCDSLARARAAFRMFAERVQ